MNESRISRDDPKLTAYALSELEGAEHAEVEQALRLDPALRTLVEEIQATGLRLETALADEPEIEAARTEPEAPAVNGEPLRRAAILPGDDYRRFDGGPLRQMTRFPQFYYVIGGLAAACFAVMIALQGPPPVRTAEKKHYVEVPLRPPAPPAEDAPQAVALPVSHAVASAETTPAAPAQAPGLLEQWRLAEASKTRGGFAPFGGAVRPVIVESRVPVQPAGGSMENVGVSLAATSAAGGRTLVYPRDNGFVVDVPATRDEGFVHSPPANPDPGFAVEVAPRNGIARNAAPFVPVAPSPQASYLAGNTLAGGRLDGPLSGARVASTATSAAGGRGIAANAAGSSGLFSFAPARASVVPFAHGDLFPGSRRAPREELNTERYAAHRDNPFLAAAQNPLSTFSSDVDTASYTNVRRFLEGGRLPPADAVRIEELVNYFPYRYPPPPAPVVAARSEGAPPPFAASLEVAGAPWAPAHRLVRIGLKGREVAAEARPAANLIFLLDVSGSMNEPNKLPLVKESLRLLLGKLRRDDRVAIVTYAGKSGLALPLTPVAQSREILAALDELSAGGSTNGASGLQLAYDIAKANATPGGISRVVLCTDGDFNVGVGNQPGELLRLVAEKAKSGVFLTVLGFGMGNLQDATLESLASRGNGFYGYIDNRREAEKLLVDQLSGTLVTIAKDVKLQVDFNPAKVASYRLIGYENRQLRADEFADDRIDAGEIGAGHTVTALYEIVPVGAENAGASPTPADESKYQPRAALNVPPAVAHELLTLKVRYKEPAGDVSRPLEFPLVDSGAKFADASADFKFAAAVAGFGMLLRDSPHKGAATIGDVIAWAATGAANPADDPAGYRSDFLGLARQAQVLMR